MPSPSDAPVPLSAVSRPAQTPPAGQPTPAATFDPTSSRRILIVLWLVLFATWSQFMLVAPLLSQISHRLDVPEVHLGWLISGYAIAMGVCTLAWGPISDRLGRRRLLMLASGLMALALFAHWWAQSYSAMLLMRVLAGAIGGALTTGTLAAVGDYIPPSHRGWATGWIISGFAAGQIVGVPVGVFLSGTMDDRLPFVLLGLLMAGATWLVWRWMPSLPSRPSVTVSEMLADGRRHLTTPKLLAGCGVGVCLFGGMGLFIPFFPLWMERSLLLTSQQVAWVFSVGGVAVVISSVLLGRLSDRIGRHGLIVAGSLGVGLFMLLAPLLVFWPAGAYLLFALLMGCAAARGSAFRALQTELVPAGELGRYLSLSATFENIGYAVGSAMAGWLYVVFGFGAVAAVSAVTGVVVLVLVRGYLQHT
ncbi:MFS transporter [Desulfonatronum thioautotrophicum]|uniref:MFS transporter n=1 Tax=Desulfonatronum thioautotrophicum TaxID=617001 RepID=UPI00069A7151|nr:MFS transporter [Desulfonatronum thioautotrophicum]